MRKIRTPAAKTHRISITAAGPGAYAVSGAVTLPAAFNPCRAAAVALIGKGADPADRLRADLRSLA